MTDASSQAKFEQFVRTAGAELERALRDAGTPLPPDLAGSELVRGMIEEMGREADSESARRVRQELMAEINPIIQRLEAELPGGRRNPGFPAALGERLEQWVREKRDPP